MGNSFCHVLVGMQEAEVCLEDVEMNLDQLQSVSDTVAEYFCEDSNKFKLDECCSIFHSFCEKFMKAMQVSQMLTCSFAE